MCIAAEDMGGRCSSCASSCSSTEAQYTVTWKSGSEKIKDAAVDLAIKGSSFLEMGDWLMQLAKLEMLSNQYEDYSAVLQQVLDLMVNAIGSNSRAAAFVAVVPDSAMPALEIRGQNFGCLPFPGDNLTVYDEAFREQFTQAAERLTHYSSARKCPVGGGFAVSSTSGVILASSVTFVRGARAIGSTELAEMLEKGVIFTRSRREGVMVFPANEVKKGRAWTIEPADLRSVGESAFADFQSMGGIGPMNATAELQLSAINPVQFAGCWSTDGNSPELSQAAAALRMHEAALHEAERNKGPEDFSVASLADSLGCAHRKLANWREAKAFHERTLAIYAQNSMTLSAEAAQVLSNLGLVELETSPLDAQKSFKRALELYEERCGGLSLHTGREICNLGLALQLAGNPTRAAQRFQAALDIAQRWLEPDDVQVSILLDNLGVALRETGELQRSRQLHEQALGIAELMLGQFDAQLARILNNLALVCQEMAMAEHARILHERALLLTQTYFGKSHTFSLVVLVDMAMCFAVLGMKEQAKACLGQYRSILPARPEIPSAGVQLRLRAAALASAVHGSGEASLVDAAPSSQSIVEHSAADLWKEAVQDLEAFVGETAANKIASMCLVGLRRAWQHAQNPEMLNWLMARQQEAAVCCGGGVSEPTRRSAGDCFPPHSEDTGVEHHPKPMPSTTAVVTVGEISSL